VSLEDKLGLLAEAEAGLRGDGAVARTEASCLSTRTEVAFASTEGATCTQTVVECGGVIQAWAVDGAGGVQVRSHPSSHGGSVAQAGWEHVLGLDLAGHAPRVAEEAVALLTAPPCPAGRTTLVLGGEQLALQVHESIGHALELDRILLGEASYAGTSWVAPDDLGSLRYGSEHLHVTADGTAPRGLDTYGWDDEGVAAARTPLIEGGVLRAALSDRQSAAAVGLQRSAACARADGFARQPIVRMTNVSIEPGEAGSLEDLLADTGEGLYLETTARGRSTIGACTSSSPPRSPTRSATAGWGACCATPPTPGSLRASGPGWTRCARRPRGACTACCTAARANRARSCASPTARHRRAFATSRSASHDRHAERFHLSILMHAAYAEMHADDHHVGRRAAARGDAVRAGQRCPARRSGSDRARRCGALPRHALRRRRRARGR
jgi:hypothetical protein